MNDVDPLAPLAEFDTGPWHVTVRQRVTGGLYWEATREGRAPVMLYMPMWFTIEDARENAVRMLRGRE